MPGKKQKVCNLTILKIVNFQTPYVKKMSTIFFKLKHFISDDSDFGYRQLTAYERFAPKCAFSYRQFRVFSGDCTVAVQRIATK